MGRGGFSPCPQRRDCGPTIRLGTFEAWRSGRRTPTRVGACCRWRRFRTGCIAGPGGEHRRHGPTDVSRLGSPVQCLRGGWVIGPLVERAEAAPVEFSIGGTGGDRRNTIEVARLSGVRSHFTPARLVRTRGKRRVESPRKRTRRNFVAHVSQLSAPPLDPTANHGPVPAPPFSSGL